MTTALIINNNHVSRDVHKTWTNLVPRRGSGEKTLAHSELKRSLIGAFHSAFIRALSLVYSFQNKDCLLYTSDAADE